MTKSGGVLAYSVTLYDEKYKLVTFPAGSTPPAWAQALITNPKAWETTPSGEGASSATPEASTDEAPEATDEPEEDLLGVTPEPPKRGAGSGRPAWAAYADSLGVTYASDASRDDIIAAVEAAAE